MQNIFDEKVVQEYIQRINQLQPTTQRQWGKMDVAQMLAHLNVPYQMFFQPEQFKKPSGLVRWILKTFVKPKIVKEGTYKQGLPTSKDFIKTETYQFEQEKSTLIEHILKFQKLGSAYFDGKENLNFGKLSTEEWNNMLVKHLNHHLEQFGV